MPEFREQFRQHYDAQALPPAKVEAILRGEAGTASREKARADVLVQVPRARFTKTILALAALALVFIVLTLQWQRHSDTVPFAVLAPSVVAFFQTPPDLPKRSGDPGELHAWLVAQGAPADLRIPSKLQPLQGFGCKVVDVGGQPAYLACFWRQGKESTSPTELVHLWTVRRRDFRDTPPSGERKVQEMSGWSFVSWSEGDLTYTLAAAAPPETLMPFLSASRATAPRDVTVAMLRPPF
jgi:hypothetical protein